MNKFVQDRIFIIAEAGVNHNGDLSTALKMVDAAKVSGADAVKFQTFTADSLVTKNAAKADYQKDNMPGTEDGQYGMLKELELSAGDFRRIKEHCDEIDIIFLSTPFDDNSADLLDALVPIFKISSTDVTNLPFLEYVSGKGKPVILSVGMSTMEEVQNAVRVIRNVQGNVEAINGYPALTLLHCTTSYPCRPEEVNLKAISTLHKETGLPTGYSDHTEILQTASCAAIEDVSVLEKHFTFDKNMKGPDHKASLDPAELNKYVRDVRTIEVMKGKGTKEPTESERKIKDVVRKSLVAAEDLKTGDRITRRNVTIKRPGMGIQPVELEKVLNMEMARDKKKDEVLMWEDIR